LDEISRLDDFSLDEAPRYVGVDLGSRIHSRGALLRGAGARE